MPDFQIKKPVKPNKYGNNRLYIHIVPECEKTGMAATMMAVATVFTRIS
jgi:hypothetical protein